MTSRPGNVLVSGFVERGDPEKALAEAAHSASGTIETSFVEHAYIEPEAGWAEMDGDTLVIRACTQAPYMDRDDTATRARPCARKGAHRADRDRRRLRLQARHVGAAADRSGRAQDRPACGSRLHALGIDDVDHQASPGLDAGDDRRRRRGPRHRHGLHRRFQYRRLCELGADGDQPRAGPCIRPVSDAQLSRHRSRDPHQRADLRRLPRLRRAASDDHAGDAVRRTGRQARHRSAGLPPEERVARRLPDRDRPKARSRRRHRRLPRRAGAALAARAG